jgi:hypothetical protein
MVANCEDAVALGASWTISKVPAAVVRALVASGAKVDARLRRGRSCFASRLVALERKGWSCAVMWSGNGEGRGRSERRMRRFM